MKLNILLFGVLAEEAGSPKILIEGVHTLEELKEKVKKELPSLSKYSFQVSVNRDIVRGDLKLNENDEIAFLPPFAGG